KPELQERVRGKQRGKQRLSIYGGVVAQPRPSSDHLRVGRGANGFPRAAALAANGLDRAIAILTGSRRVNRPRHDFRRQNRAVRRQLQSDEDVAGPARLDDRANGIASNAVNDRVTRPVLIEFVLDARTSLSGEALDATVDHEVARAVRGEERISVSYVLGGTLDVDAIVDEERAPAAESIYGIGNARLARDSPGTQLGLEVASNVEEDGPRRP